jgi:hypothetical protein
MSVPVSASLFQVSVTKVAAGMADRVLGALGGADVVGLAECVDAGTDMKAALGAVRLVGADLFAPHQLLGRPVHPRDATVIADSFAAFPTTVEADHPQRGVAAWRDWATASMLARTTGVAPPTLDLGPPTAATVAELLGDHRHWRDWSACAAQLSPLALPGLDCPAVLAAVFNGTRPLAQGATRALLRRDFVTAARLVRWIALLASAGVRQPVDPFPLVEQIRLYGGTGSRLALDLAIARQILGLEPA